MMAFSSQMDVYQSYKFKDYLTALSEKDIDVFSENIIFLVAALFLSLPLSIATKRLEASIRSLFIPFVRFPFTPSFLLSFYLSLLFIFIYV
jgi:ABC-type uncharacterized transport system fused permease/ATPase subunit